MVSSTLYSIAKIDNDCPSFVIIIAILYVQMINRVKNAVQQQVERKNQDDEYSDATSD